MPWVPALHTACAVLPGKCLTTGPPDPPHRLQIGTITVTVAVGECLPEVIGPSCATHCKWWLAKEILVPFYGMVARAGEEVVLTLWGTNDHTPWYTGGLPRPPRVALWGSGGHTGCLVASPTSTGRSNICSGGQPTVTWVILVEISVPEATAATYRQCSASCKPEVRPAYMWFAGGVSFFSRLGPP